MRIPAARSLSIVALAGLLLTLCAARAGAQEQEQQQGEVYRLFLPGYQRALEIDLRRFSVEYEDLPGEPTTGPHRGSRARLLRVTFVPEKGKRKLPTWLVVRVEESRAEAEALREVAVESLLKHDSVSRDSVRREAHKETALLRYTVKGPKPIDWMPRIFTGYSPIPVAGSAVTFPNIPSKYPVLEAFRVRDGVWVWVRCNAFEGKGEEEKLLHTLIDSVKVVDTSRPSTSFDYYHLGRALYQQKEHGAAVAALEKALDLERGRRQLGESNWRQLIMALANALGAADDAARAREVLEYAVGPDPTYAPFHYGLARLHGFFGEMDRAVASLQKSYEHAPKPGGFFLGVLPDPLTDVAFRKFKDDPKFRDALKAMKKRSKK